VTNNTCIENDRGISLDSSNNNSLITNTVQDNDNMGIRFYDLMDCDLIGNIVANNIYGLYISGSNNIFISENEVFGSSFGIALYSSTSNCIVFNNTAHDNGRGINLQAVNHHNISYNTGYNNSNYGIFIYSGSMNNTVFRNEIFGESDYGIRIFGANQNKLIENYIHDVEGIGIDLYNVEDTIVYNNTVSNSDFYGIVP